MAGVSEPQKVDPCVWLGGILLATFLMVVGCQGPAASTAVATPTPTLPVSSGTPTQDVPTSTVTTPFVTPTMAVPTATPRMGSTAQAAKVSFGDFVFTVELAVTPEERALGLSGRVSLDRDQGMLFVYAEDAVPGFWMSGMLFPLDIVWLDSKGEVVDVTVDLLPAIEDGQPPLYYPLRPVRYVLEINAGLADELGIHSGSRATFSGTPDLPANPL